MATPGSISGATVSSLYTKTASTSNPSPKLHSSSSSFPLKTGFQGVSLEDSKKSVSEIFAVSDRKIGVLNGARRFEVKARTAASKTIEVEVASLDRSKAVELSSLVWKEVGTQQKRGLNLEIKFCTQAASLEMSFGLLISWASLKPLFRPNLILSTLLLC
ncbi:unnamed protein product [Brassica oleracea]